MRFWKFIGFIVGPAGFEPASFRLKAGSSASWATNQLSDDESTWTINLHRIRMLLCPLSYVIKSYQGNKAKKEAALPLSYGFLFTFGEPGRTRTPDPPIRIRSISFLRHLIAVYTGIEPVATHRQWVMFAITPIDFEIAVKTKQWFVLTWQVEVALLYDTLCSL